MCIRDRSQPALGTTFYGQDVEWTREVAYIWNSKRDPPRKGYVKVGGGPSKFLGGPDPPTPLVVAPLHVPWYDDECCDCKRTTRSLERTYRRSSAECSVSPADCHAWQPQFQHQSKSGRPQSVKIVDYCGRRSVSSWNCQRLSSCIHEPQEWCVSRRLQLNATKTELTWFRS